MKQHIASVILAFVVLLLLTACGTPSASAAISTPTPTTTQHIQQIAAGAATAGTSVVAQYNGPYHIANITVTLPKESTHVMARDAIQENCFAIQRALWSEIPGFFDIEVDFPAKGSCILDSAQEAHFSWSSLTPATAWSMYNQAVFQPSIAS